MKRYILFLFLLFMLPIVAFSQSKTSSAIQGVVTDVNGKPLPGANVVAIHKPSGTRYGTITRKNGHFTFTNVRPGGPYTVQVTFIGFNPQKKTITNIPLGNTATVNFQLERGNLTLDQISVTATINPVFSKSRTGAKVHLSQQNLNRTPHLTRTLSAYVELTPYSTGGTGFGGTSGRYNNIKIDGVSMSNAYGLGGGGAAGSDAGVGSPISTSAIKAINVEVAPFGVTNNNFNGALINAITKSGTNEYHGEVYFQIHNQALEGRYMLNKGYGRKSVPTKNFTRKYYGLNIGGPIIKNKLFFFVNAEIRRQTAPIGGGLPGSGAGSIFNVPKTTMSKIKNIFKNEYGYNPGSFNESLSSVHNVNKELVKINWNINKNNKLMFRYNNVNGKVSGGVSRSQHSYSFSGRKNYTKIRLNSFLVELNSDMSNNKSNVLRIGYTRTNKLTTPSIGGKFPAVKIVLNNIHGHHQTYSITAGVGPYAQYNGVTQGLFQLTDNFTYLIGSHKLTFGTSNHLYHFINRFVPYKYGSYVFRGIDEFKAGNPYKYQLTYSTNGGSLAENFYTMETSVYAQDQWSVTDRFTLTAGLRIDIPIILTSPGYNPRVEKVFGYNTSNLSSGYILWSPRLAFNWQAINGKYDTQIRGGIGIFSGTPPFVWLGKEYGKTGLRFASLTATDGKNLDIGGTGFFSPDPNNQPRDPFPKGSKLNGLKKRSTIALMGDNFKYPQSLKLDLAVDQQLPGGITATVEGIFSKDINYVTFRNINIKKRGESAHGRPIYGSVFFSHFGNADGSPNYIHYNHFNNVILLGNTNKGYRYSLVLSLKKQFKSGLSFNVSYTRNRAESVNNGASSIAVSNWQYVANFDVNHTRLGTTDYQRLNNILARVSYAFFYGQGNYSTTITLVYQGSSGSPFSWIYDGNANGDTRFDNDLVYVPHEYQNPSPKQREVIVASHNRDALNAFINAHPSLDKFRGGPVRRNSGNGPFQNSLSMSFSQKFGTFDGQSIELEVDVFNLLNLMNSKWGIHRIPWNHGNETAWTLQNYVTQSNMSKISKRTGINLTKYDIGKPVISYHPYNSFPSNRLEIDNVASRWRLQFTVKYNF